MHYQVEGFKSTQEAPAYVRNYAASLRAEARDFANHLVTKCGCDSARVLHVNEAETFYAPEA